MPTLKPGIEVHHVTPGEASEFRELPTFVLNDACDTAADRALAAAGPRTLPAPQPQ
jgi:hypothetical protein